MKGKPRPSFRRRNTFDTVSSEVLLAILTQVDYFTLHFTLTSVCRRFYRIIKQPRRWIKKDISQTSVFHVQNLLLERLYIFEDKLFVTEIHRKPYTPGDLTPKPRKCNETKGVAVHPCFKCLFGNFEVLREREMNIYDVGFIPPGQEMFIPFSRCRMKIENATHPPGVNMFVTSPGVFTPDDEKQEKSNAFETESEEVVADRKKWHGGGGVTFEQAILGALRIINRECEEVRSLPPGNTKSEKMRSWSKGFVKFFDVVEALTHAKGPNTGVIEMKVEFPCYRSDAEILQVPVQPGPIMNGFLFAKKDVIPAAVRVEGPTQGVSELTAMIKTNQAQVACAKRNLSFLSPDAREEISWVSIWKLQKHIYK